MVTPYYAVKCNPDPTFLNLLYDAGLRFDCASERELSAVAALSRGPPATRIVYANPCKSERDILAAKQIGSPITVVDSVEEVEKLAVLNYTGGALVRIAVDDSGSDMPFSSKFGAPAATVASIFHTAAGLQIPLMGISFHVGSGSKCATAVADAIAEARQHFGHFKGGPAPILDIGGGFLPDATDFQAKAAHIRKAIATLPKGIELWAEPGRFFAANSFDFFVKVIGKKPGSRTILEGDSSRQIQDGWKYTLDDSIYGQFSNILFDKARPSWIRVPCMGSSGDTRAVRNYIKGTLFGRTCDSLDMIAKSDHMEELEIGDWLWFPRMGAYTQATASEFNGFPMPDTCVVEMEDIALGEFPWNTPKGVRYQTGLSS